MAVREGSAADRVSLQEAAAQVGVSAHFESSQRVLRQIYMEFEDPERPVSVPAELEPWTVLDPVLRAFVKTRINARPRIARLTLTFENTIDVEAEATVELAGRGIGVGGAYRKVHGSVWTFEVEFWPTPRRSVDGA